MLKMLENIRMSFGWDWSVQIVSNYDDDELELILYYIQLKV